MAMGINFVKYRKFYFIFSALLIAGSIVALAMWGLKPGIEFTGGSILELAFKDSRPSNQQITDQLNAINVANAQIQPTGDRGVIMRLGNISEETHQQILGELRKNNIFEETRFDSVGPLIGKELKQKTITAAIVSLILMIVYIAFAFRKVQRPVSSWIYGIISFIGLCHDIFIPLGVFAILGKFYGIEITIPVITAFLTVLGSSINNTIVVFDRIRENLLKRGDTFENIVNGGMTQTLARQINTSIAMLLSVVAIFLFGGITLKYFALALIVGILAGTYSSFFISAPLLVTWYNFKQKRAK